MYAKYVYNTGATLEQIHDDMFEIFTGETNVNNLSAGCDTTNSFILTTYSTSPWADYDDVSTTERIMRMEMNDDSGVYKYVGWHHNSGNDLGFAIMESWDAGTDTPTNEVEVDFTENCQAVQIGTGGDMHIYSSQFCTMYMHRRTSNIWGMVEGGASYGSHGIFECSRDHPALHTGAGGMPNWFSCPTAMIWGDGAAGMDATFWKGRDNTDTVQTPFTAEMGINGRSTVSFSDSNAYPVAGALGSSTALTAIGADTAFALEPIMVGGGTDNITYQADTFYGNVSSRCDIWFMAPGSEGCGELVILNSLPYIVFKSGYTAGTAGDQYGGKLIVPYG